MSTAQRTTRRGRLRAGAMVGTLATVAIIDGGCGGERDRGGGSGGGSSLKGSIRSEGSSTVGPLSEAAAERFQGDNPDVRVTVGTSGTGGGCEKFCAGETDLSDASREIKEEEAAAC